MIMVRIPVGWERIPVVDVHDGDVLRFLGEVLDVFETAEMVSYGKDSEEKTEELFIEIVTPAYNGRGLATVFYFSDEVQILLYEEIDELPPLEESFQPFIRNTTVLFSSI
jgi:hypothetical protein